MKIKRSDIREAIIALVQAAGRAGIQPSKLIQERFNISRQQVSRYLHDLVQEGIITPAGAGRGQKYFPSTINKEIVLAERRMTIAELKSVNEDGLYLASLAPHITHLSTNIKSILHHGFTELVNNVIDHAESSFFSFSLTENTASGDLILDLDDDGIGVFRRNQIAFGCKDLYEAVVETVKGRRTSQPAIHAGEGLFFTSRIFDYFRLRANGIEWLYLSPIEDWSIAECPLEKGSHLKLKINSQSNKKIEDVFKKYTDEDFQFTENGLFVVEPLTIAASHEHVSRSEAKRLLLGAEKFKHIIIDFKNTIRIGQGFADEIFRVFRNQYPGINIEPRNMNQAVRAMVQHVVGNKS